MTTNTERLAQEEFERVLDAFIERDPDRAHRFIEEQLARLALKKRLEERRAALSQHAAEQAEEALPAFEHWYRDWLTNKPVHMSLKATAADAFRAGLAAAPKQAEQQAGPVGEPYGYVFGNSFWEATNPRLTDDVRQLGMPLYTHPAPSQERDKVDAERYRAIRTGKLSYTVMCEKATFYCGGHTWQPGTKGYPEAFDAAIDAARAAGKEQPST